MTVSVDLPTSVVVTDNSVRVSTVPSGRVTFVTVPGLVTTLEDDSVTVVSTRPSAEVVVVGLGLKVRLSIASATGGCAVLFSSFYFVITKHTISNNFSIIAAIYKNMFNRINIPKLL